MLGFSWGEIAMVAVVAILVLRPEDMPATIRQVLEWVRDIRKMASNLMDEAKAVAKEAGLDEVIQAKRMIKGDDGALYESYETSDLSKHTPTENKSP